MIDRSNGRYYDVENLFWGDCNGGYSTMATDCILKTGKRLQKVRFSTSICYDYNPPGICFSVAKIGLDERFIVEFLNLLFSETIELPKVCDLVQNTLHGLWRNKPLPENWLDLFSLHKSLLLKNAKLGVSEQSGDTESIYFYSNLGFWTVAQPIYSPRLILLKTADLNVKINVNCINDTVEFNNADQIIAVSWEESSDGKFVCEKPLEDLLNIICLQSLDVQGKRLSGCCPCRAQREGLELIIKHYKQE